MGKRLSAWVLPLWALIKKDVQEECRTRHAVGALTMFTVTTVAVMSFALGPGLQSANHHAALLWIALFFSAMSALGRCWLKEEEKNTTCHLYLSAPAPVVFLGKLFFNLLAMTLLSTFVLVLYFLLLAPQTGNLVLLLLTVYVGSLCVAGVSTITSAISAKASHQGIVLPILSFPVILPVLMVAVRMTAAALSGANLSNHYLQLFFLIFYTAFVVSASLLLFDYVWEQNL